MNALIRGHDYRRGVDLALTGSQWRSLLSTAEYTRRIGTGVLAYDRRNGHSSLAYEIYDDDGAMPSPRRRGRT
jgi:hypothetical protein